MKEGAQSCTMSLGGRACVQVWKMLKMEVARSCLGARVHCAKFLPGRFVLARFLPVWLFLYFCLGNVFGLQTWSNGNLALIPNDVYRLDGGLFET